MRRRLALMIGLDLDNDAADAVDQQRRPDQVGRHLKDVASEEGTLQRPAQFWGGPGRCGIGRGNAVLSHSRNRWRARKGGIGVLQVNMLGNIGQ
jgi:hypothetical protein